MSSLDHDVRSDEAEAGSDLDACVIHNVHWSRTFIATTVKTAIKKILNQSTVLGKETIIDIPLYSQAVWSHMEHIVLETHLYIGIG